MSKINKENGKLQLEVDNFLQKHPKATYSFLKNSFPTADEPLLKQLFDEFTDKQKEVKQEKEIEQKEKEEPKKNYPRTIFKRKISYYIGFCALGCVYGLGVSIIWQSIIPIIAEGFGTLSNIVAVTVVILCILIAVRSYFDLKNKEDLKDDKGIFAIKATFVLAIVAIFTFWLWFPILIWLIAWFALASEGM